MKQTKIQRLLTLMLAFAMVMSLAGVAIADEMLTTAENDYEGNLVILHTNDVHTRVDDNLGYATAAAAKKYYESLGADVLLLDAGDTLHGFPIANLSTGSNIVEIMNKTGYDAMCPGNHDFNYGADRLIALSQMMDFPLLSANFTTEESELPFAPYVKLEAGDYTVGIVGLTTPETKTKSHPNNTAGYTFNGDKLAEIAQEYIDILINDGADFIIVLGHLGVDTESAPWRSTDVIAQLSGVDVFIDGHSHTEFPEGEVVDDKDGNAVVIAQTGDYLRNLGIVTLNSEAIIASFVSEAELAEIGIDDEVAALVTEKRSAIEPLLDEVLAKTTIDLNGERAPGVRTQETNLGNLAADALRYVSGADVAMTNGGGIRVSLPIDHTDPEDDTNYIEGAEAGDITYGDLNKVFPFGNVVVTIEISGADLIAALEHGTISAPDASGGFPQVSGVTFDVYTGVEDLRVQNVKVNGEPLILENTYTFATNDFTQASGDGYTMLGEYPITGYFGALDEALVVYITEALGGVVGDEYAKTDGRINQIGDIDGLTENYDYIITAVSRELMKGTGNGKFSPEMTLDRAQVVTVLYRIAGEPEVEGSVSAKFTDVADNAWYADAVLWGVENGIIEGASENTFNPTGIITRQEFITFVYRYLEMLDLVPEDVAENTFADKDSIAEWAIDAVNYGAAAGIVEGDDLNNFSPSVEVNRSSAAKMFVIFYGLVIDETFETEGLSLAA